MTQLKQQLQAINFVDGSDILVLTGDIIDRGSENAEIIQFVTSTPGIYSVLGNHESMFLEATADELVRAIYTSDKMGSNWIEKYTRPELEEMAALIKSYLPIAITVELKIAPKYIRPKQSICINFMEKQLPESAKKQLSLQ